jgi:hypothetical protein
MAFLRRSKDPLAEIQTCLQKRDYKAALPYFNAILTKSPANTQIRLRFADTLILAGSKKEAINQYRRVADELAESGFMIRAIAIYKKIVQLDPSQVDVRGKLSELREQEDGGRPASPAPPIRPPPEPRIPEAPVFTAPKPAAPPVSVTPPPPVERAAPPVPTLTLEESMALEFGSSSASEAPAAFRGEDAPPSFGVDSPVVLMPDPAEEPTLILEEEESPGFDMGVETDAVPTALPPAEEPVIEMEIAPEPELGMEAFEPTEVAQPPPLQPEIFEEQAEAPFMFGSQSEGDEPVFGVEHALPVTEDAGSLGAPMPEAALGEPGEHEPALVGEILEGEGEEPFVIDFEMEPDAAADGANPLVGLLGEDVDAMIDSIMNDVSSAQSGAGLPSDAPTHIPLFSHLSTQEFIEVALMLVRRAVKAGTVVVREGEPGTSMFIVSTGEVVATRQQRGVDQKLSTMKDGDFFGEIAVLTGEPRRATVTAVQNTELLELSREHLQEIFSRHPGVEAKLRLAVDERLMKMGSGI